MELFMSRTNGSHTSIRFLSTVRWLRVSVPVLSLHRTSIPAISSIAVIRLVIAPWTQPHACFFFKKNSLGKCTRKRVNARALTCWERRWEPIASVTDSTVGIAMGMPPINRTRRLFIPSLYVRRWTGNMTMISRSIPMAIEHMQKFPMEVRTWERQEKKFNQKRGDLR